MTASTVPMYMKVGKRAALTAGLAWARPNAIALRRTAAHSGTRVRSSRKSMPRKNTSSQSGAATAVTSSAKTRMMPSTVKAITGRRSSQRNRSAACGGAVGAGPSIELIMGRRRKSAGDPVVDPIAVWQPQGGTDLEAQPREDDLRLQKVALNVRCGVPPEVVFRRGVAQDPDRHRPGDGIVGPALAHFPAIDVRQPKIGQDQCRDTGANEGVRILAGARVLEGDAVTTKLHQIEVGEIRIVVDQEDPSLPRHTSDIKRGRLRATLRQIAEPVARCRISGGRSHPVFCGAIGVIGAEGPEPNAPKVERNPQRRTHHCHIELRADHKRSDDGSEERQPLQRRTRVPVTESRNEREARRPAGVERPVLLESLGAVDDLAAKWLHLLSVLRFCADSRRARM